MLVYHRREVQKSITWARLAVVILHLEKSLVLITIHKGGVNHQPAVRMPLIYGGKKKLLTLQTNKKEIRNHKNILDKVLGKDKVLGSLDEAAGGCTHCLLWRCVFEERWL